MMTQIAPMIVPESSTASISPTRSCLLEQAALPRTSVTSPEEWPSQRSPTWIEASRPRSWDE